MSAATRWQDKQAAAQQHAAAGHGHGKHCGNGQRRERFRRKGCADARDQLREGPGAAERDDRGHRAPDQKRDEQQAAPYGGHPVRGSAAPRE